MKRYQILSQKYPAVRIAVRYQTTPCIWKVQKESGDTLPILRADHIGIQKSRRLDAWSVREAFFAATKSEHLLPFLRSTGRFTTHSDQEQWSYEDFGTWKRIIRALISTRPEKWRKLVQDHFSHERNSELVEKFAGRFLVDFTSQGPFYLGVISVENTLRAMIASVYVDWMAGVKQGFCERPDCGKPFEITSAHKRRYCSQQCAHHQLVKRSRERAKQTIESHKATLLID